MKLKRFTFAFACFIIFIAVKKTATEATRIICETYSNNIVAEKTCRDWFARFKNGDFDVNDRSRFGRPETIKYEELQILLDENSAQTPNELAIQME